MAFVLRNFVESPSVSKLQVELRKQDWRHLAQNYDIPAPSSLVKQQLKEVVIKGLVAQEILTEEAYQLLPQASFEPEVSLSGEDDGEIDVTPSILGQRHPRSSLNLSVVSLEAEKIKLEREKLAHQERERAHQERERVEKIQFEREKLAHQERERAEKFAHELEMQKRDFEHQLELARSGRVAEPSFQLNKQLASVPNFNETDPEYFFRQFERLADHLKWPEEEWVWLIQGKLTGTAAKVFNSLEDYSSYDLVKTSILTAYQVTPESYRQKFRNLQKSSTSTFVEFASEKLKCFKQWLFSTKTKTYDDLVNLMVLEEFKRRIPFQVMVYLNDKDVITLNKAALLADQYAVVHRLSSKSQGKATVKSSAGFFASPDDKSQTTKTMSSPSTLPVANICNYCKQPGHDIAQCLEPGCRKSMYFGQTQTPEKSPHMSKNQQQFQFQSSLKKKPISHVVKRSESHEDIFRDFKYSGELALTQKGPFYPITILRDTGAAQSLLFKKALPGIVENVTGNSVTIGDFSTSQSIPLARVFMNCNWFKKEVVVGIRDEPMPIPGV